MVRICSRRMMESLLRPTLPSRNVDMGRKPGFPRLAGDGRRNDRGGMAVSGVVLHDQNRPGPSLLAAHDRRQIGIEYVAPFD